MFLGVIRNNSLVGGLVWAEVWTAATKRVTLYCTWRPSGVQHNWAHIAPWLDLAPVCFDHCTSHDGVVTFSVRVTYDLGSVRLRQQCCNMLFTSAFMDEFMFSHNGDHGTHSQARRCFVVFARWRHLGRSCCLRLLVCNVYWNMPCQYLQCIIVITYIAGDSLFIMYSCTLFYTIIPLTFILDKVSGIICLFSCHHVTLSVTVMTIFCNY